MPASAQAHESGTEAPVLFVGSLFNRRHIPELIAGFERVAARHPSARLELVGDNRTQPYVDVAQLIANSPVRDRIRAAPGLETMSWQDCIGAHARSRSFQTTKASR